MLVAAGRTPGRAPVTLLTPTAFLSRLLDGAQDKLIDPTSVTHLFKVTASAVCYCCMAHGSPLPWCC